MPAVLHVLTLCALVGLFVITIIGATRSSRPKAPSISVIIEDDTAARIVYGLVVGIITVLRTGMVFQSIFFKCETTNTWSRRVDCVTELANKPWLRRLAAVFGSAQLVCFGLVGMVGVSRDPVPHYVFAVGTAVFTVLCESILLFRRWNSNHFESSELWANTLMLIGIVVSLGTFGITTLVEEYAECLTYVGISEWIGYYLVLSINLFRSNDVLKITKDVGNKNDVRGEGRTGLLDP